uniref:Serpin domain-containing protein n=1 Tax=Globodera rostochiensis TaxID=31243 RepID=A0A914GZN6_GLORO
MSFKERKLIYFSMPGHGRRTQIGLARLDFADGVCVFGSLFSTSFLSGASTTTPAAAVPAAAVPAAATASPAPVSAAVPSALSSAPGAPKAVAISSPGVEVVVGAGALEEKSKFMPMVQHFEEKHGYERDVTLLGAPYDWRRTANMVEMDSYFANLTNLIEKSVNASGQKAFLVCHSMGNLIVNYFLNRRVGKEWQQKYLNGTINVSAPWAGSLMLVEQILSGPLPKMSLHFNLALIITVLQVFGIEFNGGCDANQQSLVHPFPTASEFNAKEMCRAIEGTSFHEQCLLLEVVKQKGFIPKHLRPPCLDSKLFEDNELPADKARVDGYYEGTTASNDVNPGEEYCASTYKMQDLDLNRSPNLELNRFQNLELNSVGQAEFSVDLLKAVYRTPTKGNRTKNTVLSPLSATIALALAYAGARGQTAAEFGKVLAGDSSDSTLHINFGKFLQEIASNQTDEASKKGNNFRFDGPPPEFMLRIANRIYLANTFNVLDEFKSVINTHYGDNFESIDFEQNVKATQLDMMQTRDEFFYVVENNFKMLGMAYVGEKANLFILLPNANDGLKALLNELKGAKLMELAQKSATTKVKVILPKFKIESSHQLKDVLPSLGIESAFDPTNADFSGISNPLPVYISKVIQKAMISIDENGTEAAAATAVFFLPGSSGWIPAPPSTFRAEHPFAFFRMYSQKHVMFSGVFMGE